MVSFSIYLLITFFVSLILIVVGKIFIHLFLPELKRTPLGTLIGVFSVLVTIVSIYGIIKSNGTTICWAYLLSEIGLVYFIRKTKNSIGVETQIIKSNWLEFLYLVVSGLACVWTSSFAIPDYKDEYRLLFTDHMHYSKMAQVMQAFGLELNSYDLLGVFSDQNKLNLSPYHFFEIWFTALVSETFHLYTAMTFELIVLPVFTGFCFLSLMVLLSSWTRIKPWHGFLVLFSISFSGLDHLLVQSWIGRTVELHYHLLGLGNGKLLPLFPFFIVFLVLYFQNYIRASFFFLACIPIFFISSAMLIVPLFLLLGYFSFYLPKDKQVDISGVSVSILTIYSIFFAFYFLFSNGQNGDLIRFNEFSVAASRLGKEVVFELLLFPLLYLSCSVIFIGIYLTEYQKVTVLLRKKSHFLILIIGLTVAIFAGMLVWVLFPNIMDGFQFFWMLRSCMLPVLVLASSIVAIRCSSSWLKWSYFLLSGVIWFSGIQTSYSFQKNAHIFINPDFRKLLQTHLDAKKVSMFGIFTKQKTTNFSDNTLGIRSTGNEISLLNSNYIGINLSVLNDPFLFKNVNLKRSLVLHPLYVFWKKNLKKHPKPSNQMLMEFISENKIGIIYTDYSDAIPIEIRRIAVDSLFDPSNKGSVFFMPK